MKWCDLPLTSFRSGSHGPTYRPEPGSWIDGWIAAIHVMGRKREESHMETASALGGAVLSNLRKWPVSMYDGQTEPTVIGYDDHQIDRD